MRTLPVLSLLLLLSPPALSHVEPPNQLTANAGDDIIICAPGQSVTLNGSVNGLFSSVSWDPGAGMSNPGSLTPSVFVSQTTTFTLTANGQGTNQNLIVNGDFSAGISGFTSDYVVGTGGPFGLLSNEGTYEVSTNASLLHNNWQPCTDHTGGGNMMVVNGATTPGENVWCQTVPVVANTVYEFSAWLTSVIAENPAILQFSINGVLIGAPFNVSPATCLWNQFFETWDSGPNASATICITNQNTVPSGNDFAIDDISFGPVCTATDEVTVFVINPIAIAVPAAVIPCDNGGVGIMLDGNGSSTGPDITYLWTTPDGNIVSGETTLTPTINAAGTYTLTVSQESSFGPCTATAEVVVIEDIPPVAVASTTDNIDCNNPLGTVSGANSTVTASTIFQWTTVDGTIVAGEDNIIATVGQAGTYLLTVTDLATGCTGTASTVVTSDLTPPTATATPDGDLDCNNSTVTIDGSGSSGSPNLEFDWSTSDGNIVGSSTSPTIDVDEPGTYQLVVTNADNGCTAITLAQVGGDVTPPDIVILPPANIDCTGGNLTLDASGSSGSGALSFDWTFTPPPGGAGGGIVSGEMTATPEVDELGTYTVTVTDDGNGCTATASVEVAGNLTPPDVGIAPPDELTCTVDEISLEGNSATPGATFGWTTTNGNITAGANEANATANATGTYTLTVTDPDNGCTASEEVEVTADQGLPVADAGPADELDCGAASVQLDGTASSSGTDFTSVWTTTDGNIVSGETTLTPEVNAAGTYTLTVTNQTTGCTAISTVIISQNNDLPTVQATGGGELNCNTDTLEIDATGSSSGAGFDFVWTFTPLPGGGGGGFAAGQNTLTPTVDEAGTYVLTITNLASTCSASIEVEVTENFTTPTVEIFLPAPLTCADPTLQLDATASVFAAGANLVWAFTPPPGGGGGGIVSGETTLEPTIDGAGAYLLTITDADSGCSAQGFVSVVEDMDVPDASAGDPDTLDCMVSTLLLDGSGSSQGGDFEYVWTTTGGNILVGANTLSPEIDAAGTYQLLVTDTTNGCTSTSEVAIGSDGEFPLVDAGATAELTCVFSQTNLSGNAEPGSQFVYLWTFTPPPGGAGGGILAGANTLTPEIAAAGTYTLTVTNQDNGCSASDAVTITENLTPPSANAGNPAELSCTQTELNLSGTGSGPGTSVTLNWTTQNGNIVSGAGSASPLVNAAGIYLLTVTNDVNGCTDTSSVVVTEDASLPTADAGTANDLTCNVLSLNLDGSGSSAGANFIYSWTTGDGNIVSGETTLTPTIDAPGTYLLTVTNTTSNCQSISSVTVLANDQPPAADAGQPGLLTCNVTDLLLDGSGSSQGPDFSYSWTHTPPSGGAGGGILAGANTLAPQIDAAGTYQILVTNDVTGCTSTASVAVAEDTAPPAAAADTPGLLTCDVTDLLLDGTGSAPGADVSYAWTTTDGNILAGANTLAPQIDEPGTYQILVTNNFTGCTSTASVTVVEDVQPPTADAGPADQLDCDVTSLSLDGSGSSQGPDFSFLWVTLDGNISAGANTDAPQIDEPGTYTLTVTNEQNGCTSTATVAVTEDVTPPSIAILPPDLLTCMTDEIQVDASASAGSGLVFVWATQNGNIVDGQGTPLLTVDAAGDYLLTITDPSNGCSASQNAVVGEDIDLPMVDAGPGFELHCNLPEGSLQASTDLPAANQSVAWTTQDGSLLAGAATLTPTIGAAGTYLLTVTSLLNSCTATDEVVITENVLLDFESSLQAPGCLNPTGVVEFGEVLGGQSPFQYSVDGGASFAEQTAFANLSPGVYHLVVQDANGCELDDVAFLPDPPQVLVSLDADTVVSLGDSYQLNAQTNLLPAQIESVLWTPAATLDCNDCLDPLATPSQQTTYTVTVRSTDGCTATALTTLFVRKDVNIYVPNVFSPNGDSINDVIYIFAGGNAIEKIHSFKIFSRWGENVFEHYNFPPNDPTYGWNGVHRGDPMDPAVFVWFAEVELINGDTRLLKGSVTLVR